MPYEYLSSLNLNVDQLYFSLSLHDALIQLVPQLWVVVHILHVHAGFGYPTLPVLQLRLHKLVAVGVIRQKLAAVQGVGATKEIELWLMLVVHLDLRAALYSLPTKVIL